MSLLSTVAIVGRPNVGKSTLFNRLSGRRIAVVHEKAGVTRDRLVSLVERDNRRIYFVDTGGITMAGDELDEKTTESALAALEEAGLILFMVDVRTGVTEEDLAVARVLRRHADKVWLIANKVERNEDELNIHEFYSLGLGEPLGISALHGDHLPELWERLYDHIPELPEIIYDERMMRLAVVGRPNVGKSSICNALLGEDRLIVSDVPGTTRDAVDSRLNWHGNEIVLVDTAGLRRKTRVKGRLEVYSNLRSLSAIDNCNVVLMVLDADRGFAEQDLKIANHACKEGKGMVICINKWDLVEKDSGSIGEYVNKVQDKLPLLTYAPIIFISALTKQRIHKVLETAWQVYERRGKHIATSELNSFLEAMIHRRPPRHHKGGTARFYYATQVSSAPPTFVLFVNKVEWVEEAYRRYLINRMRDNFDYEGSPIRLRLQGKRKRD
ncbi:MAG: ribosome biogenesis GTPase Der [bacterium]|nr:ribosome biogenesis GTPase Der [bacterium]